MLEGYECADDGTGRQCLLHLRKSLVLSRLDDGCAVYLPASDTALNINPGARWATGARPGRWRRSLGAPRKRRRLHTHSPRPTPGLQSCPSRLWALTEQPPLGYKRRILQQVRCEGLSNPSHASKIVTRSLRRPNLWWPEVRLDSSLCHNKNLGKLAVRHKTCM